jgi:hypothetical protein
MLDFQSHFFLSLATLSVLVSFPKLHLFYSNVYLLECNLLFCIAAIHIFFSHSPKRPVFYEVQESLVSSTDAAPAYSVGKQY